MKAIQLSDSKPRYAMTRIAAKARNSAYWGPVGLLSSNEVDPPEFPNQEWVRIQTRYGGICGSDLGSITLKSSTSTTVFASFPFTLGHENVGVIVETGEDAGDFQPGQRAVVNPLLPCATRQIDPPCPKCQSGKPNLCQNFDGGELSAGVMTGFCRDTGGSWSSEFIAHRSQVQPVPVGISDEEAVLAEPFAIALHPVLQDLPADDDQVLIIGSGIIGLCTIAAIRAAGSKARIVVTSRHVFQSLAARKLGADVVLNIAGDDELEERLVEEFGARSLIPVLGDNVIVGGANYVYDCVGSSDSLRTSIRFAASNGQVVIIGLAGVPKNVDFTPVWMNELTLRGDFCYATQMYQGQEIDPIALAMRLMAEKKADLGWLVTHRFELDDYKEALATVSGKGDSGVIKAVFAFDLATTTTSAPEG